MICVHGFLGWFYTFIGALALVCAGFECYRQRVLYWQRTGRVIYRVVR